MGSEQTCAIFAIKIYIFVICPLISSNIIRSKSLDVDVRSAAIVAELLMERKLLENFNHLLETTGDYVAGAPQARSLFLLRQNKLIILKRLNQSANHVLLNRGLGKYRRRGRKDRGKDGKEIWPDFVEEAFQAALLDIPRIGRLKTPLKSEKGIQKSSGRNELLAHKIELLTGVKRSRKQISSHIQVLQGMIKDPEWLDFVKSEPPAGAIEYDSVKGKLIFKDRSQSSGHCARSLAANPNGGTLPLPTKTLGSSFPDYPFVQNIELNMSVFPQANDYHLETQTCHIYTQIQDEMGAQPKMLQDNCNWRQTFPDLTKIYNNSSPSKGEIILLEANLELMKDYCPPKSSLAIQLFADISGPGLSPPWVYRTRFYMKGNLNKECSGQLDTPQLTDSQRSRVIIPLSSKWWVQLFYNIMERRCAIKAAGDMQGFYQYENETRQNISELSVMQEIFASDDKDTNLDLSASFPIFILLWKFRQTLPGEAATTTWRKLHKSSFQAPTSSSTPQLAQPPLTSDSQLPSLSGYEYTSHPYPELPLQPHAQNNTGWNEYDEVAEGMHDLPQEIVMTDFKMESPNQSRQAGYPTELMFQSPSTQTYGMEDHSGSHYLAERASYPVEHEVLQSLVHDMDGNGFGDPLHHANYELHHYKSHEQAAHTLSQFATQPVALDISPQPTNNEFTPRSTDTDFASQSTVDSFSSDISTNYLPHTTDPNLEIDLTSWNIQLDYDHSHDHINLPQHPPASYEGVESISPTAELHTLHHQGEQHLLAQTEPDPHSEQFHTQLSHLNQDWQYLPHDQDHTLPPGTVDDYPHQVFRSPSVITTTQSHSQPPTHDQHFKLEVDHWEQPKPAVPVTDAPSYPSLYQHALEPAHYHQLMQQEEEALQGLTSLPNHVYTHEQREEASTPELLVGMLAMPGQLREQARQHPQGFEGMEPEFSQGLDRMEALNEAVFGSGVVREAEAVGGVEDALGDVLVGQREERLGG
ncbi:Transcriptional enhancer factor TEF-1 [Xylographa opegraphella]|nr:Transcriptional enhancer factor TEF-1 [Xylographa opegraphella]